MLKYNLIAETMSLLYIFAILLSFLRDYDAKTFKFKFIRMMYYACFFSIIFTLASVLSSSYYYMHVPPWVSHALNTIYFLFLPVVSLFYVFFALILISKHTCDRLIIKSLYAPCIPYIIYALIIIANIFTGDVFTICTNGSYVRGELFRLPYIIMSIHVIMLVVIRVSNRNKVHKESMMVLSRTLLIASILACFQFAFPQIIISGSINTISVLSLHLYIQNVKRTIDQLTGLQNRMSLMHKLELLTESKQDFSLYVFSIRSFKSINERYGLEFGDKVLEQVAQCLMNSFPYEYVFRYTGDEFTVILPSKEHDDEIIQHAVASFDEVFVIEDYEIMLDIVYARVDYLIFGSNVRELISAADYSIRTLKDTVGDIKYLYDTNIVKKIVEQNKMIQTLKSAIESGSFVVHYQPIYCVEDKLFTNAEALVRLIDDEGNLIYPGHFIEIAEKTGLIVKMTYVILDIVCRDIRRILDAHGNKLPFESISVNFPYFQFARPDMIDRVMRILEKYDISPSMIKIEITERTLISDAKLTRKVMEKMYEKGFVFELDDFGIDYSNMGTFLNLPLNIIKIDRSLLLAAHKTPKYKDFFQNFTKGIKATDRIIIIEGVETKEQLDFVIKCGCEYIQGYYFSKPLPFATFESFLIENNPTS